MKRERQFRRDVAIWIESLSGVRQAEIADRHGIGQRTVRRAIERVNRLEQGEPNDHARGRLDEYWLQLEASIEDLAKIRLRGGNLRTQLAAIEKQSELMKERARISMELSLMESNAVTSTSGDELSDACLRGTSERVV